VEQIPAGGIHHLRLTVTNLERSRQFYTGLLGFEVAVHSPPPGDPSAAETFKLLFGGIVMARGGLLLGLRPMAPSGDRFDPGRVGLDHLSFSAASHDDLEQAMRLLDERGCRTPRSPACRRSGLTCLPLKTLTVSSSNWPAPMAQAAGQS
jgi:glyoxylase I family protein